MSEPSNKELLYRYLLGGLLLGSGTALASALVRTHKLNKKLKSFTDPELKRNEDTMVVPVSDMKTAQDMSGVYKYTALGSAGILSYLALAGLLRKIEDNRMKKLESEAFQRVTNKLVNPNAEKQAQASTVYNFLKNTPALRNVAAALVFLGTAAYIKKRLDRENVDSEKMKLPGGADILFEPGANYIKKPVSGKGQETKKGSAGDVSPGLKSKYPNLQSPVTGIPLGNRSYGAVTALRRLFHENPDAGNAFAGGLMDAAGYGKMKWIQKIPLLGQFANNLAYRGIGLGSSYRAGWDPLSEENSFGRPRSVPKDIITKPGDREQTKKDLADYGMARARGLILKNKNVQQHMADMVAKQKKLGWLSSWWLKNHVSSEDLLDKLNLKAPAAKLVLPDQSKAASCKNPVSGSYFSHRQGTVI